MKEIQMPPNTINHWLRLRFLAATSFVFLFSMTSPLFAAATNDLSATLQKGLFEEEANHDLAAAIQAYQSVVTQFDKDRKLAATAVFRLGECYRKQGKTNEANAQYERVLREFSDQAAFVELCRGYLKKPQTTTRPTLSNRLVGVVRRSTAFFSLFDGQTLDGWKGDTNYWSVQDGAITAKTSARTPAFLHTSLIWQGENVGDFELRFQFKFTPGQGHNESYGSVVYRGKPEKGWDVLGYECHLPIFGPHTGMLSHRGRDAAVRSYSRRMKVCGDDLGHDKSEVLADDDLISASEASTLVKTNDWNECVIVARGYHFTHQINGRIVTDLLDENVKRRADSGLLALHLHGGITRTPALIQFKDIQMRRLTDEGENAVVSSAVDFKSEVPAASTDDEEKEIRRIKALIKNSPDLINARNTPLKAGDPAMGTRLHKAAIDGQLIVAKFLLENGADVESKSAWASTPLMLAAQNGHKAMVELLLAREAKVQTVNQSGDTALHLATREGFRAVVEVLLTQHANLEARNNHDLTPLGEAIKAGHVSLAEFLIASGTEVKGQSHYLSAAVASGNTAIVELLISKGADVNERDREGWMPLFSAVSARQVEAAKMLLQKKAEVNARLAAEGKFGVGMTPLNYAIVVVENCQPEMVRLLLQHGADAEIKKAYNAKHGGQQKAFTPLHIAVDKDNREIAELLLKHGANPNATNEFGSTPFHFSMSTRDKALAELLLSYKANINAQNMYGNSPLHWAVSKSDERPLAEWLLQNGANPNLQTTEGETPLHFAVKNMQKEIMALLLAHKADPNIPDKYGRPPLAVLVVSTTSGDISVLTAARKGIIGWKEIADLLIKYGADPNQERRREISVARNAVNFNKAVFIQWKTPQNRFTLLELIASFYRATENEALVIGTLPFPDLTRIEINRLDEKTGKERIISVNLEEPLRLADCPNDIWLEWGDIVEIPERVHVVNETWRGFKPEVLSKIAKCLERNVSVITKGETKVALLKLQLAQPSGHDGLFRPPNFWLSQNMNSYLLTSSDKTRVTVKRIDPVTKEKLNLKFDLTEQNGANLWLRDGDVIEVPEKP